MFGNLSKNIPVDRILVVSLSNIGDVILTCPVIDICLQDFPKAKLSVIVGPKAQSLFVNHPRITTIVYDKHMPWLAQLKWFWALRRQFFTVIIDLRHTALGFCLPSLYYSWPLAKPVAGHMRGKHLAQLAMVYPNAQPVEERQAILPKPVAALKGLERIVTISPGAADSAKRWGPQGFVRVADHLARQGYTVVFAGDRQDAAIVDAIRKQMKEHSLSLAGQLDLRELAFLLRQSVFALTHDSAPMHLAGYFDVPVVALWGPTDKVKYGPWSTKHVIVHRGRDMSLISPEDVIDAIGRI